MVWALDPERMLSHVETGGKLQELRAFLEQNSAESLPANVQAFLRELENKTGACHTLHEALLLEWTDEALAQLIATSASTSKLCFHAGENRLVVARKSLTAFGRALRKLGYALPKGFERPGSSPPRSVVL